MAESLNIDAQRLIAAISEFNSEDAARASDAGETREAVGAYLEATGIQKKAFSHMRAGLKLADEQKQLDWLRSMEAMLPIVASHIRAVGALEMEFGETEGDADGEAEGSDAEPKRSRKKAKKAEDPEVVDFDRQVDRAEAGEPVDFSSHAAE